MRSDRLWAFLLKASLEGEAAVGEEHGVSVTCSISNLVPTGAHRCLLTWP